MEYSIDTALTSPITCVDGETTGLAEGICYVRYKATATAESSHYETVKVMDNTVTITNGAGETTTKYKSGDTVTVKVNVPIGKRFVKWSCTGISLPAAELEKEDITFTMPDNNVTLMAKLEDIIYNIMVTNGTSSTPTAKYQEEVTITANPAPAGKVFDKWTCETAGVTTEFASATSSMTTFVMPAANIEIKAHFRDIEAAPSIEIKVEGGTGGGTYKEGDSVTITANDPAEGKVFKGWQDETGKIVSTEKSYTFKVIGATTLTAVYEDAPAAKKGLSGGAITGIVIGSVLLAGIGGFAIFWFAVKKKTFADLGVVLKKGFTAMGNGIKTACRAIGNFFKNIGTKIKSLFTKKK